MYIPGIDINADAVQLNGSLFATIRTEDLPSIR